MPHPPGAFPAPTWTPPAREPFIPLRPLTLGHILSAAFRALRVNPAVVLVPALLFSLAAHALTLALTGWGIPALVAAIGGSSGYLPGYTWFAGGGAGFLGWAMGLALTLSAGLSQQGVSAVAAANETIGRRLTPGGFRRRMRGRWMPLAAWTAIVALTCTVVIVTGVALMTLAAASAGDAAAIGVGALVVLGGAALAAWLGTRLAFVPSVISVERTGVTSAVTRARRIITRHAWRTLGIRILCIAMVSLATLIVTIPAGLLMQWLASIIAGNGDLGDYLVVWRVSEILTALVSSVVGGIALVITTSVDAVLYLDTRMRNEGLDLELGHFMEDRRPLTRFDPTEPDPFRSPGTRTPQPASESPWG